MSDPVRAEKIKNEHQDKLRSKWHQVMSEIETRRTQAQRGEEILRQYNNIVAEFEDWFRDVPLKLEQVNNYEGQLESFTIEFDAKQEQIKKLNDIAVELKRLNIGYSETLRYSINNRWQEVSSQFKRFSGSKDKDKHVTDKKVEMVCLYFLLPIEFVSFFFYISFIFSRMLGELICKNLLQESIRLERLS